jgi:hypothetical protein
LKLLTSCFIEPASAMSQWRWSGIKQQARVCE